MLVTGDDDADRQAMMALAAGDDLALNDIIRRWQHRLIAFILRMTGDPSTAADLAQETFVRVYKHRRSFHPRRNFSSWIFTIASNLARNHHRWRRRHPVALEDPATLATSALPSSEADPAEQAALRDRLRLVQDAIAELPYDLRNALVLSVYEQLSHEEIAAITDTTVKAVELRVYRARRLLRDRLGDLFPTEH